MNQFVPNHHLVASMPRIEDPGAITFTARGSCVILCIELSTVLEYSDVLHESALTPKL
eukprot:COSAG02_NODE_2497_length_8676_cov_18.607322_5_plen_58_part_00